MLTSRLDRRGRGVALLVLAVLLAHALLLAGIEAPGLVAGEMPTPAVQLSALPVPSVPAATPPEPLAVPAAPARASARPTPRAPRTPADPVVQRAEAVEPAASQAATDPVVTELADAVVPAEAPSAPAIAALSPPDRSAIAEPPAPGPELPRYRTRLPSAGMLLYDLQRGRLAGTGELRWLPEAERYELVLEGSIVGVNVLTQVSRGGYDAAGLAPQRYTDRRARRPAIAATFDHAAGKVTFSVPSHELPLLTGVQDRLSWMIQLAAIAAADPQWLEPGARVTLQVVGARGDAALWVFRCVGVETLDTAAGGVDAVRFVREPRGPYDTGVEVWLDPARHHLPVRATIRNGGEGEGLELRLREARLGG